MEIVTWRGFASLARLALIGVGVAFACAVISLLVGVGGASAHADDGEERGLLGAVTDLVDDTTSLVGATVTEVDSATTTIVETVVAVVPAPAQAPVQAVTQTVGDVAGVAVAPVQQTVSNGVVGALAQPVVELAVRVPVVGEVVTGLSLDAAVSAVGASADDLLRTSVGALSATPSAIGSPRPSDTDANSAAAGLAPTPVLAASDAAAFARADASARPSSHATAGAPGRAPAVAPIRDDAPTDPRGAVCPSSLVGSSAGGIGAGAWALVGLLPFAAHRAWVRRAGAADDDAPPPPFFATDVSPD
ncbi:hypothetical protein [Microbacterium sp. RU33B]|uniref:hypothetical protein n=1 Tax=Microbacterium sp. RU33B TaxID=1907390 RepID=UPI00096050A6|nr:hypothetical protein [Microbacterium sp. RU33B]SIT85812.1 hypothetical protein SAMN05880545_2399 [Microbacterium sp. RU33B]